MNKEIVQVYLLDKSLLDLKNSIKKKTNKYEDFIKNQFTVNTS